MAKSATAGKQRKWGAHHILGLDPAKAPKKWAIGPENGQLHVGALIFYRGERYWVSRTPISWSDGHFIRICSNWVDVGKPEDIHGVTMSIHGDCVERVLDVKTKHGINVPTVAKIARAERAKIGVKDVDDEVAQMLRPLDLEQMYQVAAQYLKIKEPDLRLKYSHLNLGMQRMNLGNRIRAKYRETNQEKPECSK